MTPSKLATYIHDLSVIAQTAGVMLEVGVPPDSWHDLMHILRGSPQQKSERHPPFFVYNGVRVEPHQGITTYGYRR